MTNLTNHAKKRANSRGVSKIIEIKTLIKILNGIDMKLLKEKLEALMNEQGELYYQQIKLINKSDLEIINTKINTLTEEIFEISNQIFDMENEKL